MTPLRNRSGTVDTSNFDSVEFESEQIGFFVCHFLYLRWWVVELLAEWLVRNTTVVDSREIFLLGFLCSEGEDIFRIKFGGVQFVLWDLHVLVHAVVANSVLKLSLRPSAVRHLLQIFLVDLLDLEEL